MTPITPPSAGIGAQPLRLSRHLIPGAAAGFIAPFTGVAWPFAILVGFVIGGSRVRRLQGVATRPLTSVIEVLAVTGGVLAMLFFGAILGGLISFLIAALAGWSEETAAPATQADRTLARLTFVVAAAVTFVVLALLLNYRFDLRIG